MDLLEGDRTTSSMLYVHLLLFTWICSRWTQWINWISLMYLRLGIFKKIKVSWFVLWSFNVKLSVQRSNLSQYCRNHYSQIVFACVLSDWISLHYIFAFSLFYFHTFYMVNNKTFSILVENDVLMGCLQFILFLWFT